MTHKSLKLCRKFSLAYIFMLLLQQTNAQYDFSRAETWLNENIKDLGGRAVLVVYKDGKIIHNNAVNEMTTRQKFFGKMIARKQGKNGKDVLKDFDITTKEKMASCSKWLSAALVMTFVDEGKLSLEDTIGKFLPVFSKNAKGHIKIWQCLSHLTGIMGGNLSEELKAMKQVKTMDEAMEMIASKPMEGEPGKVFRYGNTGLQIAGAILEKISGKDFGLLFRERIAIPCEMRHTDFGNGPVPIPAGSGNSTAEDYIHFLQMVLQKGMYNGKQVLKEKSLIEMQKDRVKEDTKIAYSPGEAGEWGYGFGVWVIQKGGSNTIPEGVTSPGLFGSFPWVDSKNSYGAFLFTFNIKSKGRNERYMTLKKIVDDAVLKKL